MEEMDAICNFSNRVVVTIGGDRVLSGWSEKREKREKIHRHWEREEETMEVSIVLSNESFK